MLGGWPVSKAMPTLAILSAVLLAGCGAPSSGSASAAPAVPANIDCSGPSVGGAERGAEMGGGTSKKGKEKSGTVAGIVAHGDCKIVGVPDTAALSVIVRVQAPTVRLAFDGVNGKVDAAVGILRSKGVAPADIRGGITQVVPVASRLLRSASGIGGFQITGFAASRTMTATLHDLAAAGPAISMVADSTGDSGKIQVTYYVADDSALRDQARTAAIQQAEANAKQLASGSGVALGELASIAEMNDDADPKQAGMYQESVDMVYAVDG
jgi:uncharacterized protein YggE